MEFDRKKIKTIQNCEEVKSGDVGWFSDSVRDIQAKVVLNGEMDTIDKINISTPNGPFQPMQGEFSSQYFYPYEPPKKEYRKFDSPEEFIPFRDRWVLYGGKTTKINSYSGFGVSVGLSESMYNWVLALEMIRFEDGTPFGMEVKKKKN